MRTFGVCVLVFAAVLAAGCGGKEAPSGGNAAAPDGGAAPGSSASSIVGTWVIDVEATLPGVTKMTLQGLEAQKGAMTPEQFEQVKKTAIDSTKKEFEKEMAGNRVVVKADGTYEGYEKDKVTGRGTWKLEGTKLTITETERDGAKVDTPDVVSGTYVDGKLRVRPDESMPFDLVLRRQ